MMMRSLPFDRDRAVSAVGAAALQAVLLYALFVGLAVEFPIEAPSNLKLIALAPSPPPPPEVVIRPRPQPPADSRTRSGGSPPNIRSTPTPVFAPHPIVRLPLPPVVAAPIPALGSDPSRGAADKPGPGFGTGGRGRGTGDGIGDGPGDGDGSGFGTPPRLIRGRLRDSDYPRGLGEAGIGGTVSVRYRVEADGRVTNCEVTESSGSVMLDDITCRLIEQRFRFDPSRDGRGRPVGSYIVENHSWLVEDEPATDEPPRRRRRLF